MVRSIAAGRHACVAGEQVSDACGAAWLSGQQRVAAAVECRVQPCHGIKLLMTSGRRGPRTHASHLASWARAAHDRRILQHDSFE